MVDIQFRNKTNSYRSTEKKKSYLNQNKEAGSSVDYLPLNEHDSTLKNDDIYNKFTETINFHERRYCVELPFKTIKNTIPMEILIFEIPSIPNKKLGISYEKPSILIENLGF